MGDQHERARDERNRANRRARLVAARLLGTHTKEQWRALVAEFGGYCVRCQGYAPNGIVKDHIVPLYQGGSDGIDNLQPICAPCNGEKRAESTNWVAVRRAEVRE